MIVSNAAGYWFKPRPRRHIKNVIAFALRAWHVQNSTVKPTSILVVPYGETVLSKGLSNWGTCKVYKGAGGHGVMATSLVQVTQKFVKMSFLKKLISDRKWSSVVLEEKSGKKNRFKKDDLQKNFVYQVEAQLFWHRQVKGRLKKV